MFTNLDSPTFGLLSVMQRRARDVWLIQDGGVVVATLTTVAQKIQDSSISRRNINIYEEERVCNCVKE